MGVTAYFMAELALGQDLHTYAGGAGVVGGCHLRAAKNLKKPMVGVSIFWSEGYYDQELGPINGSGRIGMQVVYRKRPYNNLIDTGLLLSVKICGCDVWVKVLEVPQDKYNVCPTYLLTTDIPENDSDPLAQLITRQLYQGNEDRWLAQQIVLSKGIEALEKLGYEIDTYHLNEGFCLNVGLELLSREIKQGLFFNQALMAVKKKIVFTTHTPEIAGNRSYRLDNMFRMNCFDGWLWESAVRLGEGSGEEFFNTTAALLRMAKISNAVSRLHGDVANKMWCWVQEASPIISITNGKDTGFWQPEEFKEVRTSGQIASVKMRNKRKLLQTILSATDKHFSENVLTVVWARRFAAYKRPKLILYDLDWISDLLARNKLQLIFAGKPHPEDRDMINTWNHILRLSEERFPNLVILPGYELEQNMLLKAGADVWLNTPRRPREACGTSYMSAAMMGVMNVSVRDGGALEGIVDGENGFLFGVDREMSEYQQDVFDAESLRDTMKRVITLYYSDKEKWYEIVAAGKRVAETQFSAERMVREYFEKMYEYRI